MKNYFKKFSIIFVMALAIIGVGVIQNGSVANAATVGQQLTSAESGWTRYDDTDSTIKYSSKVTSSSNEGFHGASVHLTSTIGETATFKFKGSKLRLLCYGSANRSDVTITIDSLEYISSQKYNGIFNCLFFEKPDLSNGNHLVEIKQTQVPGSDGGWNLDAIDIDDTGYLLDPNSPDILISLTKSSMDLKVNESKQLTATTTPAEAEVVEWSSSDTSIATVDSTGKVTGIKEGQVTITAKIQGSQVKATCEVNVTNVVLPPNPVSSIILDNTAMNLIVKNSKQLTATTTPTGTEVVEWSSSDTSIATVVDGKVTGIEEGKVTITAQIKGTDIVATCEVTVGTVIVDPNPPVNGDGSLYIEMVDGNVKQAQNLDVADFIKWFNNRDLDDNDNPIYKINNAKGNVEYLVHDKIVGFEVR